MCATQVSQTTRMPTAAISAWRLAPAYPLRSRVPFLPIMTLIRSSLASGASDRQLSERLRGVLGADELLATLIDADAPLSGGPLARPRLMFEEYNDWRITAQVGRSNASKVAWRVPADRVTSGAWRALLKACEPVPEPEPAPSAADLAASGAALLRREHASVEFQSAGGTRLVFDPVFLSLDMGYTGIVPPPAAGVTAAFVTHSHGDHFDIATLDYLARSRTAVYVPEVPRRSLLAQDMADQLRLCGIPCRCCAQGSVTTIGDVAIEALPFYGEQPSARVSPVDTRLRNWGCCYRIDSDRFSALLLADSGADPNGDILAAISDSVHRRGPIDLVLGCLRNMYLPFETSGLPSYYTVLPMSGLRSDYELLQMRRLPSVTLGVAGIARACAEAKARVFLPYAHGLTGYGEPIREHPFGPGHGLDETAACRALSEELRRIGCGTTVAAWNPGDRWSPPQYPR
jgi:L-ascorbate metabolism protein UlaG (beta-lactamase superfamily)